MSEHRRNDSRVYSRGSNKNRNGQNNSWLIIGGGIVIVLLILIIVVNLRNRKDSVTQGQTAETTTEQPTFDSSELKHDHEIDLSGIPGIAAQTLSAKAGMNRTELLKSLKKLYQWKVTAVNSQANTGDIVKPTVDANETTAVGSGDVLVPEETTEEVAAVKEIIVTERLEMPDFIEAQMTELMDQLFQDDRNSDSDTISLYHLTLDGIEDAVEEFAQDADDMWYVEAKGGSIESYDPEKDEFLMEGSSNGCKVDKEKLAADLTEQIRKGNFECSVPVKTEVLSSEGGVLNGEYQIIAEYVTHTTNNSVRNKNVRLACEKLNGTIIRPGEEFSYNYTIGERTEEKGYGTAAAYSNGEVVQEVGGGVCQVSSTLYNAITEAGLKTTFRSPHTFKPTYVTPGQDATVSWGGPDYRFANVIAYPDISYDTTYAIGIRSVYKDQTVTVSIYGRPVLKPGYEMKMESEMTAETEIVRETIPEGSEKEPTEGDKGSTWKTYLHITKDGEEVSRELYHSTTYKGHTEYYYETESTEETSETDCETYPDEFGPGFVNPTRESSGQIEAEAPESRETEEESEEEREQTIAPDHSAPSAQVIDAPGGIPGITEQETTVNSGPRIIQDGP